VSEEIAPILTDAEADPEVVGVLLKGSRAVGTDDADSDWDAVVVLRERVAVAPEEGRGRRAPDNARTSPSGARLRTAGERTRARPARQDR